MQGTKSTRTIPSTVRYLYYFGALIVADTPTRRDDFPNVDARQYRAVRIARLLARWYGDDFDPRAFKIEIDNQIKRL